MDEYKNIGLNIWGIRGGFRSFCHSDNLNVDAPEILNTWKDIRDFVYVSDLNVRFYALEFTPHYKVFTLYRPENDTSRTGAYVATTLYVPHGLKVNRILDLMRQISDAYHRDHYDAFGNPNTNPDYPQLYLEMIKNYAGNVVKEMEARLWDGSAQDNTPRILPFSNIATVERFFDKPYRKEFLRHQEVMFWDAECLQNQQSHGLKFLKSESLGNMFDLDGKGIAEEFNGGKILNAPQGFTVGRFERKGIDISQNWQAYGFYDDTDILITLRRPFYQPLPYNGPMTGAKSPFVKRGVDYDFRPNLPFEPLQYDLPFSVPNVGTVPFDLYFGNQRVSVSGGRGSFHFDGTQANGLCKVCLKPDGINELKVSDLNMTTLFANGGDELASAPQGTIDGLQVFKFVFNQDCSGSLKVRGTNCAIPFHTLNKVFETVLPANKKDDLEIQVPSFKAETAPAEGGVCNVTLTKESFRVLVELPKAVADRSERFILSIGKKEYKGLSHTVPFAEKDSQGSWKLYVTVGYGGKRLECPFELSKLGDDVTLRPQVALLRNDTGEALKMSHGNDSFDLSTRETLIVPATYEPKVLTNAEKYVRQQGMEGGLKKTTITKKEVPVNERQSPYSNRPIPNSGSHGNPENHGGGGGRDRNRLYRILFLSGLGLVLAAVIGVVLWLTLRGGKPRYLRIQKSDYYTFSIIKYSPDSSGRLITAANVPYEEYELDKKCTAVKVHAHGGPYDFRDIPNGHVILPDWDTLVSVDPQWFTKGNHYTYSIVFDGKVNRIIDSILTVRKQHPVFDEDAICQYFEKYLKAVWSLECSVKMLDSLAAWNDSINNRVVKGMFKDTNPNYQRKKDIVSRVTEKDRTTTGGDDWIKALVSQQGAFFSNLKDQETTGKFSRSKRSWFNNYKSYFTEAQQGVIVSIDDDDSFGAAQDLFSCDTIKPGEVTYREIKDAVLKQ